MVALPNFLHERATVDAASAGKHVFLEKPMADTLEECDRILASVQRAGTHLLVAHSQRYFASTIRARGTDDERTRQVAAALHVVKTLAMRTPASAFVRGLVAVTLTLTFSLGLGAGTACGRSEPPSPAQTGASPSIAPLPPSIQESALPAPVAPPAATPAPSDTVTARPSDPRPTRRAA